MNSSAPFSLCSPFLDSSSRWTEAEQLTFSEAHAKAKEIEAAMQKHASCLIYSPTFESRFPELFATLVSWIQPPMNEQIPESLARIQAQVTKHLMKDKIEISVDFARALGQAHQEINRFAETGFDGLNFSSYRLTSQFLNSYLNFLQSKKSDCETQAILNALYDGRPPSEVANIDSLCAELNETLIKLDTPYLSQQQQELATYPLFFSVIEKILLIAAKTLVQPHQFTKTHGNSPLELGIGLSHNGVKKQRDAQILEMVASDDFRKESVDALTGVFRIMCRYSEAQDGKERYDCAREIIQRFSQEFLGVPLSLKLNAYRVASRYSEEFPLYFKNLTLGLAKQVLEFKKEQPQKIGASPNSSLM